MKVMYLLFPLLFLTGCDVFGPVTPSLPPETQEGAGTFGALVDGVVWRPNNGGQFFPLVLGASYGGGSLIIYALDREEGSSIGFELYDVYKFEKTYELIHDPYRSEGRSYINYTINHVEYNPTYLHKGFLTITKLDTTDVGFVSGTFYFDAVNKNDSTDIIHITDGRFDVRF